MIQKGSKPPRFATWLLKGIFPKDEKFYLTGDLKEIFREIQVEESRFSAWRWYWSQVFTSIPYFFFNVILWRIVMFKNYLKIAMRNIRKHKGYSFINIAGLAIGLAAVILILLYVQFELSFDRYHEKAGRIYRVAGERVGSERPSSVMPAPLAPAMMAEFPEVVSATRFYDLNNVYISYGDKNFFEDKFFFTDPETFDMFSLELVKGNPRTSLSDPYSILLSESMVEKYFGNEDPMGKTIIFRGTHDFKVTGILKNMAENSHFTMNFVVPFEAIPKINRRYDPESWGAFSFNTYFLLRENADPDALEEKFLPLLEKYIGKDVSKEIRIFFQPLTRIHLHSNTTGEISKTADIRIIILLSSIAFLILVIACINYMNLATARSVHRSREIGVRKVIGANRSHLIKQFLGESMVLTMLALVLAIAIAVIFLPYFNSLVGRNLNLNILQNRQFLLWLFVLVGFVGLFAGSYPALTISAFKPAIILGNRFGGLKRSMIRNVLVIIQFMISIILIFATLVVKDQLDFIRNKDMGFERDRIIVVDIRNRSIRNNLDTIKNELERNPNILSVSSSYFLPNLTDMATLANWPGQLKERKQEIYLNFIDEDFVDLYSIEIVQGRNFSRDFPSDSKGAFLLNETAVKAIGWESAPGKELTHYIGRRTGKIVGVMKDFHMNPLHQQIMPLCYDLNPGSANMALSVKIGGNHIQQVVPFIRETMARFSPNYPFEYRFFDDIFDAAYRLERKISVIFSLFSLLAISIAGLGLFGLTSFTTEQRTKEIGIRKVLGATISRIVLMLSKEFTKWVLIANIVAWPVAYFAMNRWLQSFAYKINIGLLTFVLSALAALIIAGLTVSYQAFKAARTNPVEALKYE